jgi:general secretion pathway protein D
MVNKRYVIVFLILLGLLARPDRMHAAGFDTIFGGKRPGTQEQVHLKQNGNNGNGGKYAGHGKKEVNSDKAAVKHTARLGLDDEPMPIDITLDNMDIYPVLDQVLGTILGLNFVVDPAIKGNISLHISGSYTGPELLNLFNSILQMHGLAVTRGDFDLYKVVRKANSPKAGSVVVSGLKGVSANPGDVISVMQLKYLSAQTAIANLRNFMTPGAVIVAIPSMNAIVVSDTEETVKKLSRIIELIDVDMFHGLYWELITLENSDVDELSRDLDKIFKSKGIMARPGIDAGGLEIVSLKSINGLLVVTRWKDVLDKVKKWVHELDVGLADKGSQVYVYFAQNGKAEDIADIINQLYGGAKGDKKSSNKKVIVKRTEKNRKPVPKQPSRSRVTGELSDEIKIIPDPINNSIVFKASARDWLIIKNLLKEIDVLPRQVLIDVLIAEVSLNDDTKYGIDWYLKTKGININGENYSGDLTLLQNGVSAKDIADGFAFPAGLGYRLFDGDDSIRMMINLINDTTDVEILSSPNILAADNQTSRIEVGDDVPTLSDLTTTSGGNTSQGIQYRKTGVILEVTPSINDSGIVRMEVTQEVSTVDDKSVSGINSPSFKNRKATTYLIARDGQHIIIGGLIQSVKSKTSSGIPLLKDIPYLGYIFGSEGTKVEKKELIFILTPHVIKSRGDADRITREFAEKVHGLQETLHKQKVLPYEMEDEDFEDYSAY